MFIFGLVETRSRFSLSMDDDRHTFESSRFEAESSVAALLFVIVVGKLLTPICIMTRQLSSRTNFQNIFILPLSFSMRACQLRFHE